MIWGKREDDVLAALWQEGHSAEEIGRRIGGLTRNAVLGRVHRLRAEGAEFKHRSRTPQRRRPRKRHQRPSVPVAAPAKPPRATIGRAIPLRRPLRVLEALPAPVVILKPGEVEPNGRPALLMEICAAACRWAVTPVSPHLFCNRVRRAGSAYCDEHTLKSFQPKKLEAAE